MIQRIHRPVDEHRLGRALDYMARRILKNGYSPMFRRIWITILTMHTQMFSGAMFD